MVINMIDSNELKNIIEKSKLFEKELEITMTNIDEVLNSISECYSTNNSNTISNFTSNFKYAFRSLINNNKHDIDILEKELQLYIDISNKNKDLFNNI